jgi:hypothetical protein
MIRKAGSWSFRGGAPPREVLEPADQLSGCIDSLLNLVALQFTVALHNYSQRWHVSLRESYVKAIPEEATGEIMWSQCFVPSLMR